MINNNTTNNTVITTIFYGEKVDDNEVLETIRNYYPNKDLDMDDGCDIGINNYITLRDELIENKTFIADDEYENIYIVREIVWTSKYHSGESVPLDLKLDKNENYQLYMINNTYIYN
uniref:Uncharacterized protein n=1 Tax=Pithovirus LCDPAC02 TaxID=2506601 RepID=A0A481YPI3_9VIRU|nr:MAG: hypothetical protein LCDPAC02_02180 [Pithovirus LCDPAC02]